MTFVNLVTATAAAQTLAKVADGLVGVARHGAAHLVHTTQTTSHNVTSRVGYGSSGIARGTQQVADRAVQSAEDTTATSHQVVAAGIAAVATRVAAALAMSLTVRLAMSLTVCATRLGHFLFLHITAKKYAT